MIVLGWLIDTRRLLLRRLLLRLPQDKFDHWRKELIDLIANPIISRVALESLIGLVPAAYVIPLSCHFLSCLRDRLTSMKEKNIEHPLRLSKEEIEDAIL